MKDNAKMAPLQKRALYELVSLVVLGVLLGLLLVLNDGRLLIMAIPVAVLCDWLPRYLTRPRPDQPVVMDERDRVILSRVPNYQRFGIKLAVCAWFLVFILRMDSHNQVTVSIGSLYLLLIAVIIADAVFSIVGTMVEYWRMK